MPGFLCSPTAPQGRCRTRSALAHKLRLCPLAHRRSCPLLSIVREAETHPAQEALGGRALALVLCVGSTSGHRMPLTWSWQASHFAIEATVVTRGARHAPAAGLVAGSSAAPSAALGAAAVGTAVDSGAAAGASAVFVGRAVSSAGLVGTAGGLTGAASFGAGASGGPAAGGGAASALGGWLGRGACGSATRAYERAYLRCRCLHAKRPY